jgi:hypothetical protein
MKIRVKLFGGFFTKKIAAGLLYFILLCITAGCGDSASEDGFTLEDMANANTTDAIFKTYKSVRSESKFYNLNLPDGEKGDFTQTAVYVKQNDAVTAYVRSIYGDEYSIEQGVQAQVYYKETDGTYGVYAFFDDGYFDEVFLPGITTQILFSTDPELGEKLVSQTVEGGIRKLTTRMDSSNIPGAEEMGIPKGTVEFVYGLDAKSGLLQNIEGNIFTNPNLSMPYIQCEVTLGKDDNFQPPEYVVRCKDMTKRGRFVM